MAAGEFPHFNDRLTPVGHNQMNRMEDLFMRAGPEFLPEEIHELVGDLFVNR